MNTEMFALWLSPRLGSTKMLAIVGHSSMDLDAPPGLIGDWNGEGRDVSTRWWALHTSPLGLQSEVYYKEVVQSLI